MSAKETSSMDLSVMSYHSAKETSSMDLSVMSDHSLDMSDFFPVVRHFFPYDYDDFRKVTWAHDVNSKKDLETYLEDDVTMMLVADIMPGHLVDADPSTPTIPIMAHPPDVISDVSLEMWISAVIKANEDGKSKGAKLDFKDISVVEDCLKILKNKVDEIKFPLWLSADILEGPVGETRDPIDADKFLTLCMEYLPQATLSVGWTTRYTTADDERAVYTMEMLDEMASILNSKKVVQPVNLLIRAAFIAPSSIENLDWLVQNVPGFFRSISVWSSASDTIDVQALLSLRDTIDYTPIYYDLPEEQNKEFEEAKEAQSNSAGSSYNFWPSSASTVVTIAVALASAMASLYLYEV